MPKYIISWNAGYGKDYDTVEAETEEKACEEAYERWKEDVESQAEYGVECEWSKEKAEEFEVE